MTEFNLIATCTFGLEAVVKREIIALGYDAKSPTTGRVEFKGDMRAIALANTWLRCADRVLINAGRFEAKDFEVLFETVKDMPWEKWVAKDAMFPVSGRSVKSQLSSVPAIQRAVKKAIVERLQKVYGEDLPETGERVNIEIGLLEDMATLTLDTTGFGLHKRGYRDLTGPAPIRETMAAALVQLSFWHPDRPMIDPFCGTGTICIEAAMIGRNIAPGLRREFACEQWGWMDDQVWADVRADAESAIRPDLEERIMGTDIDDEVLSMARRHAERAGVEDSIHFQQRAFADLQSKRTHGCVVTNPPYGERMYEEPEVMDLYASMPLVLRKLSTWSFFIITPWQGFESLVGRRADRRRKLFNAQIECTYFQFHGPKAGELHETFGVQDKPGENRVQQVSGGAVFGGVSGKTKEQAEVFANRLKKMDRHRRRWPTRRGITCYRVYNREIPEVPLMVDRYEDCLYIGEYHRPHDRNIAEQADWLDLMLKTASKVLEVPREKVFVKKRRRQRGVEQYEKVGHQGHVIVAHEGGLKFEVNLSDYLDNGLFLDHRITRGMVREEAAGKHVLNMFAYTGSFSVYAAAGGAKHVTTVDLSNTYLDWACRNFELNGLPVSKHAFVRADATEIIESEGEGRRKYDLAIVDPPTFSNSKRTEEDWEVQSDHAALINGVVKRMNRGGVIYFSTNFHRFRLDEDKLVGVKFEEITSKTVPEDFENKKSHRCWRMVVD